MENNEKIDIVVLWVDGNDKKWQEEKNKEIAIIYNIYLEELKKMPIG